LIIAIINDIQREFYETLQEAHLNAFISSAAGDCLDLIGSLVHCDRFIDELDDPYRERISQNVTALEDCNELAVRMAVLAVDGIADMQVRKYTHGTGSFSIFIIPDDFTNLDGIISNVNAVLDKHEAYGIRHNVEAPDLLEVSIHIRIIYLRDTLESEKGIISEKATQAVADYINSRGIGESLIYNDIISRVMSISEYIYDMDVYHYTIQGDSVLHVNQDCEWFEKFIEAGMTNAIIAA